MDFPDEAKGSLLEASNFIFLFHVMKELISSCTFDFTSYTTTLQQFRVIRDHLTQNA